MAARRECYNCCKGIGAVESMEDGITPCPSCGGAGFIEEVRKHSTVLSTCGRCRGRREVKRYLCVVCWSEKVGEYPQGNPLENKECHGLHLTHEITCASSGTSKSLDACESSYVTARAFDRRSSPCFSCIIGKRLRRDFAGKMEN